jgi:hypothetical protein
VVGGSRVHTVASAMVVGAPRVFGFLIRRGGPAPTAPGAPAAPLDTIAQS